MNRPKREDYRKVVNGSEIFMRNNYEQDLEKYCDWLEKELEIAERRPA